MDHCLHGFPNVSQINSGSVSTLTIPSLAEYNGTVVVCEAFIRVNGTPVFEQNTSSNTHCHRRYAISNMDFTMLHCIYLYMYLQSNMYQPRQWNQ